MSTLSFQFQRESVTSGKPLCYHFHVLCVLVPADAQVMDLVLENLLADEGQTPAGAIILAAQAQEQVADKQPEAVVLPDVELHIIAVDQPRQEVPIQTGNTRKFTLLCRNVRVETKFYLRTTMLLFYSRRSKPGSRCRGGRHSST